jgi:hypothetical protein
MGWALGQFQEDLSHPIDQTPLVFVTALAKLAAQFGEQEKEKVTAHLARFQNHNNLEVQQPVGEGIRVFARVDVCDALRAPV